MNATIYGLADPRTGQLRYIGQTRTSLAQRLSAHIAPSSLRDPTPRAQWIIELRAQRRKPEIFEIESVEAAAANEAERFRVGSFRALGCDLLNRSIGFSPSLERRAKISKAQKGKPRAPLAPEVFARRAAKLRGRKRSPEAIAKTAAGKLGQLVGAEGRANIKAAATLTWSDDDRRVRQSRNHGGRPFVDQTGRRFETIQGAARALDIGAPAIWRVLHGHRSATSGYVFRFID